MIDHVKIVVFVPITHSDKIREVMGQAGAGIIGNYSHCTWSITGVGRYKPLDGSNPTVGEVGKFEEVEEERIETVCPRNKAREVINAVRKAHPYEEVAFDIFTIISEEDL
jgi:hypothetical protein